MTYREAATKQSTHFNQPEPLSIFTNAVVVHPSQNLHLLTCKTRQSRGGAGYQQRLEGARVFYLSENFHLLAGGETDQGRRGVGDQHRLVGA